MKQEFKWYLTIQLEVDENAVGTDEDRLYSEAVYAVECAQDRFFDTFNLNTNIASWKVLDEELK